MGKVMKDTEAAEIAIGDILKGISDTAEAVMCEANEKISKMLKNRSVGHFIGKFIKQWKFGEKLTNPLITFTKELKAGYYEDLQEEDVEHIHQAALDLSGLWRSEPEITAETFKSNMGYLLVQETILRMVGNMKAGDCDIKTVLSALSCDEA